MKAKSMVEAGRKKMNKKFSELEDRFFFVFYVYIFVYFLKYTKCTIEMYANILKHSLRPWNIEW